MPYIKLLTVLAGLALLTACVIPFRPSIFTPDNNSRGGVCIPRINIRYTTSDSRRCGGNATDCTQTPFHNDCDAIESAIALRQTRCVLDSTVHTNCSTILGSIVDPTDITGHADLPATPALARAGSNSDSYFISVGADGVIDTTGLIISSENPIEPTPVTLRRASDTMDGVTYTTGSFKSFVALLPSTNLGAPLSIEPTAAWEGHYYVGVFAATHPIPFTIRFNTGTTAGTITATDTQSVYTTEFDLDFTAEGVITGTVGVSFGGEPDIAEARGLIGTEGLVGGFANTDGVGSLDDQVFGGFVADNPAYTPPMNGN